MLWMDGGWGGQRVMGGCNVVRSKDNFDEWSKLWLETRRVVDGRWSNGGGVVVVREREDGMECRAVGDLSSYVLRRACAVNLFPL